MAKKLRRLRRVIGSGMLVLAGISPFVVYVGLKVSDSEAPPVWPAGVALVAAEKGELASFSLLHFSARGPTVVRFPIEAALDVPGSGTLRAESAFRIGGGRLMARALADTLVMQVPFFAQWRDASSFPALAPNTTNLGAHVNDVTRAIAVPSTRIIAAPGSTEDRFGVRYFRLNVDALRAALSGVIPTPAPSRSPTPRASSPSVSSSLAGISVEILNQGGERGSAAALAQRLQQAGFVDVRAGNGRGRDVRGILIYFVTQRADAVAVDDALAEDETEIAPIPDSLDTTADVLVLVGQTATSVRAGTSPRSSPTEVVTVP